jgi:hypothetical protein
MILRHEGSTLALPLAEMEFPRDTLDTLAAPRPAAWSMVGHRPVRHCDSGSKLPPDDHGYPSWLEDELVDLKLVGA